MYFQGRSTPTLRSQPSTLSRLCELTDRAAQSSVGYLDSTSTNEASNRITKIMEALTLSPVDGKISLRLTSASVSVCRTSVSSTNYLPGSVNFDAESGTRGCSAKSTSRSSTGCSWAAASSSTEGSAARASPPACAQAGRDAIPPAGVNVDAVVHVSDSVDTSAASAPIAGARGSLPPAGAAAFDIAAAAVSLHGASTAVIITVRRNGQSVAADDDAEAALFEGDVGTTPTPRFLDGEGPAERLLIGDLPIRALIDFDLRQLTLGPLLPAECEQAFTLRVAEHQRNNEKYYLKRYGLNWYGQLTDLGLASLPKREFQILSRCSSPFIVKLAAVDSPHSPTCLLFDFESSDTLSSLISCVPGGRLSEPAARFYVCEILMALHYLHRCNVAHRNLTLANIYLTGDGHVCVAGFEFAEVIAVVSHDLSGTHAFFAPELTTLNKAHNKIIDFWYLGVILFQLLAGHHPCGASTGDFDEDAVLVATASSDQLSFPSHFSPDACDLIRQLMRMDPQQRLGHHGADEVVLHPWFSGVDWSAVYNRATRLPPAVVA